MAGRPDWQPRNQYIIKVLMVLGDSMTNSYLEEKHVEIY